MNNTIHTIEFAVKPTNLQNQDVYGRSYYAEDWFE